MAQLNLARLENAVVPRAPVGVGTEAFDPEVPIIPELNRQRPVPGAPPPLKDSVGWQEKAFTIPGVRRRRAGRQHIRRGVENRPLLFMLRAVNDKVVLGLIRALAPAAFAEDAKRRTAQVSIVQFE